MSWLDQTCSCSCYDLNTSVSVNDSYCEGGFQSGRYHISKCDGIAGFLVEDWAREVQPKLKKLEKIKETWCD